MQLTTKFLDLENAIRHSLKSFGIRLGKVERGRSTMLSKDGLAQLRL
jgi:hypothetical protein